MQMTLNLKSYGLGNKFNVEKFIPVKNRDNKPFGGLWASPVNSEWGWEDWCKSENWGDLSSVFEFEFTGEVFVIDSFKDAKKMPWVKDSAKWRGEFIDFEAMVKNGIDAILLKRKGEHETRFVNEYSLYGWDCECVLILNPKGVKNGQES